MRHYILGFTAMAGLSLCALACSQQTSVTKGNKASVTALYNSDFSVYEGWAGEYANGFKTAEAVTLMGRATPVQTAKAARACHLPKNVTIHPWQATNAKRFFFTAESKVAMEIVYEADYNFYPMQSDLTPMQTPVTIALSKSDALEFAHYYKDGAFVVSLNGRKYLAEQDLYMYARELPLDNPQQFEWVQINCAKDGESDARPVWLLIEEVMQQEGILPTNLHPDLQYTG